MSIRGLGKAWVVFAFAAWSSCSTDMSGLGAIDGRAGSGASGFHSGGANGVATGGATVTGTGGADQIATGGAAAGPATGGRNAMGGRGVSATGGGMGAGSGGVIGSGTGGRSGSGGSGNGNDATGGAGSGARGGTGGLMGTGSGMGRPECLTANDCRLQNDCCTCRAVPLNGLPVPACDLQCLQSKCAQQQLPGGDVACVAGRCVAGFNCDASHVVCGQLTPGCPAGEVPGLNNSGNCYAGGCVPATQCKAVSSCAVCGGPDQACVTNVTPAGNQQHCVTVPPVCQGAALCGCLGPSTCIAPFDRCSNLSGVKGVACDCTDC